MVQGSPIGYKPAAVPPLQLPLSRIPCSEGVAAEVQTYRIALRFHVGRGRTCAYTVTSIAATGVFFAAVFRWTTSADVAAIGTQRGQNTGRLPGGVGSAAEVQGRGP